MAKINEVSKFLGSGWWFAKFILIIIIISYLIIQIYPAKLKEDGSYVRDEDGYKITGILNSIVLIGMIYNRFWIYNPFKLNEQIEFEMFKRSTSNNITE